MSFDYPERLMLLLLALPMVWLGVVGMTGFDPVRRWVAIGLRLIVLLLLVGSLAGARSVWGQDTLTVVAVVDQSESVRTFATPAQGESAVPVTYEGWVADELSRLSGDRRADDRLAVVTFDRRPTVRRIPSAVTGVSTDVFGVPETGSDLAAALRSAVAMFPPDSGRRIVLVSDGNHTAEAGADTVQTTASVLAAAREARGLGIPVDVLPISYRVRDEVRVDAVVTPAEARQGQTVPVRVVLRATRPASGTIVLRQGGRSLDLNGIAEGVGVRVASSHWTAETNLSENENDATRYVLVRQVDVPLEDAGAARFEAIFEPAARGDTVVANNRAEGFTLVQGQGRILIVDDVGGNSGLVLPRALAEHGIDTDVVRPDAMPVRLDGFQRYDAVVLQDVSADQVSLAQQQVLARYVHDVGGGLVMVGGPNSFGAGGWTHSILDRNILPVRCEIPSQTMMPTGALVLVIDRSGSMSSQVGGTGYTQQELANEAAVLALSTLYPQDMVGVVAFDGGATSVVPLQVNRDADVIAKKVRSIQSGGGTNIYTGLKMAHRQLAPLTVADTSLKHIILLTDGQSTPPMGGSYRALVRKMTAAGITLSTIGVGDGHDGNLLETLAVAGGGQYYPVTDANRLPEIFIKEATTIRRNLVKEEPFTPGIVSASSPIIRGMQGFPQLKGLVLTAPRPDARVVNALVGSEGEPLLSHWQVGLGRSAAFTSDAHNRWATAWLSWSGYADFWSRLVRTVARPSASRELELTTERRGDRLVMRLDAADSGALSSGAFTNFLSVYGAVIGPDQEPQAVELRQVGPGLYEAEARAEQQGSYIVSLRVDDPAGGSRLVVGGATRPAGAELSSFSSNEDLLRQVAEITGGRWIEPERAEAMLFDRDRPFSVVWSRPLWPYLLLALLPVLLMDIACRRIAWDGSELVLLVRRALSPGRRREVRSKQTLASLKRVRAASGERVEQAESVSEPAAQAEAPSRIEVEPAVKREKPRGAAAEREEPRPRPAEDQAAGAEGESKSMTGRLLAARKRGRNG
ncbi:VWA domain-containing protein [Mucisphaera calidilacus]|uniref:von Willebrand factor type A domain protein n=1 Tax=Mucisphaera calidilacus TaxID=2527982 RepID=A0A518BZK4_9BACT|nr:VWA domain-containing protein [Mucisphaera calidilacus]QDU72391.1 von Willebrand factor type A domain protein [Mucisphaera calidilacus]